MFNILTHFNETAWETDQLMRMDVDRFKEHSGSESEAVSAGKPETLKLLEKIDTLLMYESGSSSPQVNVVRYGYLHGIKVVGKELVFKFEEKGKFAQSVLKEFADRLGIDSWEFNRTHWAIKDAGIPTAMLAKLVPSYDVVLSFAGEDRNYVEQVAKFLRAHGVRVFYDEYEQAQLWGKDLSEHFEFVYRRSSQYCVIFISANYVKKMWTRHERRAALSRALQEEGEYILPARFDDTEVPGILPSTHYISLTDKSSAQFGEFILKKLGKQVSDKVPESKPGEKSPLAPVRVRRIQKNIPTTLPRITSGKDLFTLAGGVHGHYFDHDDDLSGDDVELVGGFIQEITDWIDCMADMEPLERVRMAVRGQELIAELEKRGFLVFAAKETQRMEGGNGEPSAWIVLHISVLRSTNPTIKYPSRDECSSSQKK